MQTQALRAISDLLLIFQLARALLLNFYLSINLDVHSFAQIF